MEAATLLLALTATLCHVKINNNNKTKDIKTNSCINILTQKRTNMC